MRKIISPKVVSDPTYNCMIDISPVLPMVDTRQFQGLRFKHQLGITWLIFPAANHSRMEHSFGAYYNTVRLTEKWLNIELISEEQAKTLRAYALYHDIGHPPFSHVTEPLCKGDNDELALEIISQLRDPIEQSGVNYDALMKMFTRQDPLYAAVHDKNLGAEKLDYLVRDGRRTILSEPIGITYLREHIYFLDEKLVIDEKVIGNAVDLQKFYVKMYKDVYLRKGAIIAQRMLQKMVTGLFETNELTSEKLPHLTDFDLLALIKNSRNPLVTYMFDLLMTRNLFKEAIVVRQEEFKVPQDKNIAEVWVAEDEMNRLTDHPTLQQKNPQHLRELEEKIASLAGIPPEATLVVPITTMWRFDTKPIYVYQRGKISELKNEEHVNEMRRTALEYRTLRICTIEQYRDKLASSKLASKILELL